MCPKERTPSPEGCKPIPEFPFSPAPLLARDLPNCPWQLWMSLWEGAGPLTHLQVGDVTVDVHGGCLAVLRDVLVILRAGLPIHAVDAGNRHILIAPSHIPDRRDMGLGALENGVRGSTRCKERLERFLGPWEGRGWFWGFAGAGGGRLPNKPRDMHEHWIADN